MRDVLCRQTRALPATRMHLPDLLPEIGEEVTTSISKRGSADHAGTKCRKLRVDEKPCGQYARYQVSDSMGKVQELAVCGAHLGEAIRAVWLESDQAAVIQEVPGMWRDKYTG